MLLKNGTGNVESEKNVWTTGLSIFSHMCESCHNLGPEIAVAPEISRPHGSARCMALKMGKCSPMFTVLAWCWILMPGKDDFVKRVLFMFLDMLLA